MQPLHASAENDPSPEPARATVVLLVCALGIAFNIWVASLNRYMWGVDFNQFYAASHLSGTGHLYDWEELRKAESGHGPEVPTGRLPVVAYGQKPISGLPYPIARWVWFALSIAALVTFGVAWPHTDRLILVVALAWSVPCALILVLGQDTPFWLAFVALGATLLMRNKPVAAGIVLAFCICKYQLAVGLPIMLVAQRRWRTVVSAAGTVTVFLAASFLIEGRAWTSQYFEMLSLPIFSPAAQRMPNLHGLVSWFPLMGAMEIALSVAVAGVLWVASRRTREAGPAVAAAVAAGLLLSHHSYGGDSALLMPLSVLTARDNGSPGWLRAVSALLLTPLPLLLLVSSQPLLGQIFITAFVITVLVRKAISSARTEKSRRSRIVTCG